MNTEQLKEIKFKKDVSVRYETSAGAITPTEKVIMTYNVWADKIKQRGGFEMYDNSNHHAEGGLWFRENELVDYDGTFSLDLNIIDQLGKWGFNVDDMRKSMTTETLTCELCLFQQDSEHDKSTFLDFRNHLENYGCCENCRDKGYINESFNNKKEMNND
tara:strand:- start:515 stop:994 length:480 start_codon:yes stop_codon:yes gene_type:complete